MENQQEIIIPTPQKDTAPVYPRYTQISNAACNMQIVRLLKQLYAGRNSAFTNFSTNIYGQIISSNNAALSTALANIVNDDLAHLKLLGNAIIAFGGNARFTNGQGTPWSARYVNYPNSITDLVRNIIRDKERKNQSIQSAILKISNDSLKALLNEIYEDNTRNISILQPFLNP